MTYKYRSQNMKAAVVAAVFLSGCNPFTHDGGAGESGGSSGSGTGRMISRTSPLRQNQ